MTRADHSSAVPETPLAAVARAQELLVRSWPAAGRVRLIETHISRVVLAGRFAYKIKKPVDLGFLDFSTLDRRRHCCEEELRLNRRLAPELYLGVVPITGTPAAPVVGGEGAAFEVAVKMRRFAQSSLLDRRLASGRLPPGLIDELADRVAAFHASAARCSPDAPYGSPEVVWDAVAENFRQLRELLPAATHAGRLDELERWSRTANAGLEGVIATRRRDGFVRECHGDLHLGNIALWRGRPLPFDCIEFNPKLRWIDVISEIAFMVMDLAERGRPDLGHRFLDRWLQASGDYAGLRLLPFYQVYRALVRAKVAAIRAGQENREEGRRELAVCEQYLDFAMRKMRPSSSFLALMHGVSGSGKTWVSQALLEASGAVRLRSDVERKRLAGLAAQASSRSPVGGGLYGEAMTEATYARLADLARDLLRAGNAVVIDAASLKTRQRAMFRRLAEEEAVPFSLVACRAPEPVLRGRLLQRATAASDASEADAAVLECQKSALEPLTDVEERAAVTIDTSGLTRERLQEILSRPPFRVSS